MSKPQLVVLSFLKRQPMYGYKIGQIVEEMKMPVWAGIKLPSIYKAMQSLEQGGMISGKQQVEGNNPPRTVYHIKTKGQELLREMVLDYLKRQDLPPQDWWLVLSFSAQSVTRDELEQAVTERIELIKSRRDVHKEDICRKVMHTEKLPGIMKHIINLGERHSKVELDTLKELLDDIQNNRLEDLYVSKGD